MALLLAAWSVLNVLVTTMTSGALAHVLMGAAGWPDPSEDAAPVHRPALRWALSVGLLIGVFPFMGGLAYLPGHRADDEIQIIAHRGAAGARPENTVAAFALAIEEKATWVELDLQESADGNGIVMHDSDYMKIAGVDLKVWDATMDTLADIDIGSWFDPAYASERTPLLRGVLELANDSGSGVLIELKHYGHDDMLPRGRGGFYDILLEGERRSVAVIFEPLLILVVHRQTSPREQQGCCGQRADAHRAVWRNDPPGA